jgi:hypothetical protein
MHISFILIRRHEIHYFVITKIYHVIMHAYELKQDFKWIWLIEATENQISYIRYVGKRTQIT